MINSRWLCALQYIFILELEWLYKVYVNVFHSGKDRVCNAARDCVADRPRELWIFYNTFYITICMRKDAFCLWKICSERTRGKYFAVSISIYLSWFWYRRMKRLRLISVLMMELPTFDIFLDNWGSHRHWWSSFYVDERVFPFLMDVMFDQAGAA